MMRAGRMIRMGIETDRQTLLEKGFMLLGWICASWWWWRETSSKISLAREGSFFSIVSILLFGFGLDSLSNTLFLGSCLLGGE